jgi:hypothetical protein
LTDYGKILPCSHKGCREKENNPQKYSNLAQTHTEIAYKIKTKLVLLHFANII